MGDRFRGREPHVAVFVVMHIDFDCAGEGGVRGREEVDGAPAAVPVGGLAWWTMRRWGGRLYWASEELGTRS